MEQNATIYPNIFTTEERKKIIAQSMRELRIMKGLSQKEVAAALEISQATYSAYERGRNEPPAEMLVRMSYLFDCSLDILMQRDRLYRDASQAKQLAAQAEEAFAQLNADLIAQGVDNEGIKALMEMMGKLTDVITQTTNSPEIAEKIDESLR